METKQFLYLSCGGVALLMSSKVAARGGGPATWGLLLLALAGLALLAGLDLWAALASQMPRGRGSARRRGRRSRGRKAPFPTWPAETPGGPGGEHGPDRQRRGGA